jgi:arylsulfatase
MNRRDLIRNAVMSAGAVGVGGSAEAQKQRAERAKDPALDESRGIPGSPKKVGSEPSPNILWVCTDQQRFDTLQGLSNSIIKTPNLAKFMGESTTFTNVFVQTPICSPSRGSFLTGRYPHSTGLRANGQYIRSSEILVPRILADNGYTCGLAGKLHLAPCSGHLETNERINDGYKLFEWSHDLGDGGPDHNAWLMWLRKQGIAEPRMPRGAEVAGMPIAPKYTQTAWCAGVGMQFMRDQKDKGPWMMSVNIFQPHHPFFPSEEYLSRVDPKKMPACAYKEGELANKTPFQQLDHHGAYAGRAIAFTKQDPEERQKITAAYYAMIEQVDTSFGDMMQTLEETGQADNTIVIFMSDHGEMLGDHGLYLKGPYFYDCLTRVPLIIRWPKHFKAGKKVDALVEMIDLAPTLIEACGIPAAIGMQGDSLIPLLTTDETKHRDNVYTEYYNANFTYPPPTPMLTSVRTTNWKLNYCDHAEFGEMYDLVNDPLEYNNLWNDVHVRDHRDEMMQLLLTRMIDTLDPLPKGVSQW